jgi:hypothetical protein
MNKDKMTDLYVSLFQGDCGHMWVGATGGSYGCPICCRHEGDHHLTSMVPIALQLEDWGTLWGDVAEAAERAQPNLGTEPPPAQQYEH